MTLFIRDYETEDVMFQTDDFNVVPNKGEKLLLSRVIGGGEVEDFIYSLKQAMKDEMP